MLEQYFRRIDDLGRIAIPKELRMRLGIRELDELRITVDGERIVIAKKCEEGAEMT